MTKLAGNRVLTAVRLFDVFSVTLVARNISVRSCGSIIVTGSGQSGC